MRDTGEKTAKLGVNSLAYELSQIINFMMRHNGGKLEATNLQ